MTPRPRDLTVEDILAKLTGFPAVPDQDSVSDGQESEEVGSPVGSDVEHETEPRRYAIRRMMRLLAPLSAVQPGIDSRDWSRWCKELRDDLCAMAEQEEPMLRFFRAAGTNPLPILCDKKIIPKGAKRSELEQRLREVAEHWDMTDLPSLWEKKSAA